MSISFKLITLCHKFGNRARAMLNSISNRTNSDINLSLHVFYSNIIDFEKINQGNGSGPFPIHITSTKVDNENILKRAKHFHNYVCGKCDYVIYIDSDLWFPKDFWINYELDLKKQEKGYWGCYIREIPEADSEKMILNYKNINESDLSIYKINRYNHCGGRPGHFQCVPYELRKYPMSEAKAVNEFDGIFSKNAIEKSNDKKFERRIGSPCYHFNHPFSWKGTDKEL